MFVYVPTSIYVYIMKHEWLKKESNNFVACKYFIYFDII